MTIFPRLQLEGGNQVLFLGIMGCRKPTPWLNHGILFAFLLKVKRASLIAQLVKNPPAMEKTPVRFLCWEVPWRRDRLPTPVFLSFPCGSAGKESVCNCRRPGFNPCVGKIPCRRKRLSTPAFWLGESMNYTIQRVRHDWVTFTSLHFNSKV